VSRLARVSTLALAAFLVSCGSHTPTGPQPGTLQVKLQDPNGGADGAILLTLSGPTTVTNVVAAAGDTLWTTDFSATVSHVLLTGHIGSGTVLRFDVPDVGQVQQYIVSVNQAAASSGYALRSLASYVAFVSR